ncbi:Aste57867_18311 [Aphanomyces stellatus]|uniref:Aste57867_18311 protein n=1 Tax=Aphanomyces stellatus TaxID=120398 RepID=A0A485LDH0_9STRA|nr:hypothetical protein As57867_018249 [Aphanomyces stellatus]VFT95047.1 Aste57867_18311 [Aphanomyces stellatus]
MDQVTRTHDERAQLQAQIDGFPEGLVKTHMLKALADLDAIIAQAESASTGAPVAHDPLVLRMKSNAIMVKKHQDALVAIVHFMMQEAGFVVVGNGSNTNTLFLPRQWDKDSDQGTFIFVYTHPLRPAVRFTLKALFIGRTLAIHIAGDDDQVHSIAFKTSTFVREPDEASSTLAADVLQESGLLRLQWNTFVDAFRPTAPLAAPSPLVVPEPPRGDDFLRADRPPAPMGIPSVGRGDVFPDFAGRNHFPGTEVGPDHPLFAGRFGQGSPFPSGPVPGARFDPYGPVGPIRPGGGFQPFPGRLPRGQPPPFGGPDPDHLPMPGHMDDMFS